MKTAKTKRKGGGVRGSKAFARKFAKGNAIRMLAFRIQTSLRTAAGEPPTAEVLAAKFAHPQEEVDSALSILVQEGRARILDGSQPPTYVSP